MGNYIELMRPLAADNQALAVLKDNFNKDAQNMNLNWPKLSMERRRELTSNMKSIQTQIVNLETGKGIPRSEGCKKYAASSILKSSF